jgi:hypothetical protein
VLAPWVLSIALLVAPNSDRHALFRFADPRIGEASGIAAGVASPGVFYVVNDSGDTARFFAVNATDGATVATVRVEGAQNVDWEDIATAPDARGRASVWLADIGDNDGRRREVRVYRVIEPHISAAVRNRHMTVSVDAVWRLRYPDGPVDAESLAVAPDGSAYVVSKSPGAAAVYRLPAHPDGTRIQTMRRIGVIPLAPTGTPNPFGLAGQLTATGAAASADGTVLAVRTYADAYVWRLGPGGVPAALRSRPVRVRLPRQRQGEGIAVSGHRLIIDSEGVHSAVYAVPLPRLAPRDSRSSAPTAAPSAPTSTTAHGESDRDLTWELALAAAALAVAGFGLVRIRKTRRHDELR